MRSCLCSVLGMRRSYMPTMTTICVGGSGGLVGRSKILRVGLLACNWGPSVTPLVCCSACGVVQRSRLPIRPLPVNPIPALT